MSELQKASWGWLGEHVHASAPQSPRLQLPRSTTSPSQGVIVAAAAEAAARLSKVVRRWRGRCSPSSPARPCGATLASGALPWECPAGRDGAQRGCLRAGARLCGPPVSPGEGVGAGAEQEEPKEEKPSERPPAARSARCRAAE